MNVDHAAEIKNSLTDPRAVCEQLGLVAGKGTFIVQGQRGVTVRCPWHEEKSPSCSVTRGPDGTIRVHCFGCGAAGDVLALVAQVRGLSTRTSFKSVLAEAAFVGGLHGLAHEIQSGAVLDRPSAPPPPPVAAPREYPPAAEVARLLDACNPVTDDPEIMTHLTRRGVDPELVADARLGFALPKLARCPAWARFGGATWVETGHRLVLPVRDASGGILSVRAWRVAEGDSPKRLPPGGHRASGLVLSCPMATSWLRGEHQPARVLVVEGEPDFLHAAAWRMSEPTARIGIVSGSWSRELSAKFRAGMRVLVWTHVDPAGEKYAEEITRSTRARGCFVERWTPKEAA